MVSSGDQFNHLFSELKTALSVGQQLKIFFLAEAPQVGRSHLECVNCNARDHDQERQPSLSRSDRPLETDSGNIHISLARSNACANQSHVRHSWFCGRATNSSFHPKDSCRSSDSCSVSPGCHLSLKERRVIFL
ncbi:hypothetical protein J6590_064674 [Homalodisca vitripennis]|nr:hypothetical protein J6590_064674 [Homalodisca vitripennis]